MAIPETAAAAAKSLQSCPTLCNPILVGCRPWGHTDSDTTETTSQQQQQQQQQQQCIDIKRV